MIQLEIKDDYLDSVESLTFGIIEGVEWVRNPPYGMKGKLCQN